MRFRNEDFSSLSHRKCYFQYNIVFAPKYRRKAIYNRFWRDVGTYLRRSCYYKGVEIVEAKVKNIGAT